MRESRTYGSVRGARGNSRPYREGWLSAHLLLHLLTSGCGTNRRSFGISLMLAMGGSCGHCWTALDRRL